MRGALLLIAALLATSAGAQQVYRCGNVYQQAPCTGGRAIDVSDERSGADRKAATAVAEGNARLGADMERERRAREAGMRPALATGIGARTDSAKRPAAASKSRKAGTGKTEFEALGPGTRAPRKPKPASANQS